MSKQKKARTKKYSPVKAFEEIARQTCENALNRIAFIGASNRRIQPYGGRGFHFTVEPKIRRVVSDALASTLFHDAREWKMWMGHFYDHDGEIQMDTAIMSQADFTLSDFTENVMHLVNHTKPEEWKDDPNYIGWAFFAAPNDKYDLEQSDDRLAENFIASGLLERETHWPEEKLIVTRQELAMMLLVDHRKFNCVVDERVNRTDEYKKVAEQILEG
ncbi:hypothetical protein pEaSNUABM29_00039 [Erwinia phage pEa_SNUABM_29]|nr:hypothetical protein pEaSNUABM29_00039 [Erwinia phage pEa_SNUABM_29]